MKPFPRLILASMIVAALTSSVWANVAAAQEQAGAIATDFVSGEPTTSVVVGFDPTQQAQAITSALMLGATSPERAKSGGFCVVQVPAGVDGADFARELSTRPGVKYAEPDSLVYAALASNDPGFGYQWGMSKIGAPSAWDITRGAGVKVAVVDTGADLDHPDLVGRLDTANDYDFVNHDSTAQDDHGHGTHVSGIVGATLNNGIGVAGVANECTILPVKVLSATGSGSSSGVSDGIRWAADHGAKVINLSLGGSGYDSVENAAVQYAVSRDCVVVAASGNDGANSVLYPAAFSNVIGVGSSNSNDTLSYFSNYGAQVDVTAPGYSIYSTTNGGGYGYMSGTSMATPYAAGVVALIRAKNPTWNRSQVESQLLAASLDLGGAGRDDYFGYGRVRAAEAVGWTAPVVTGSLTGVVTSGGTALPGVAVSLPGAGSAITAANGAYAITGVVPGAYSATYSKTGYTTQVLGVTIGAGATTSRNVSLAPVVPPGVLTGSVSASGTALAGATVSVPGTASISTASDGTYSVRGITPGRYDVTFAKGGFGRQTRSVTISSATTTTENVALVAVVPGDLSGVVTASGGPLEGVEVSVPGTGSVTTSADGAYAVANIDPGTYDVTFAKGGYDSVTRRVIIVSSETLAENVRLSVGVAATSLTLPEVSPKRPAHGGTATLTAWLTPGPAAAAGTTTLALYHQEHRTVRVKVRGKWKRVRVHYWHLRSIKVMSGSSDGRLTAKYRLPYAGSWKTVAGYSGAEGFSAATSRTRVFSVR